MKFVHSLISYFGGASYVSGTHLGAGHTAMIDQEGEILRQRAYHFGVGIRRVRNRREMTLPSQEELTKKSQQPWAWGRAVSAGPGPEAGNGAGG